MALELQNAFMMLENWGLTDVLLPFLLVFTIGFAVFEKAKILGEDKKKFNVVVAMVLGFAVVMPHITGRGPDVVPVINNALAPIGAVAVAIIMALFLMGITGSDTKITNYAKWIMPISAFIILYIFGVSAGWWYQWGMLDFLFDSDTQALILIILVFGLIIWFVTGEGGNIDKKIAKLNKKKKKLAEEIAEIERD